MLRISERQRKTLSNAHGATELRDFTDHLKEKHPDTLIGTRHLPRPPNPYGHGKGF